MALAELLPFFNAPMALSSNMSHKMTKFYMKSVKTALD